MFSDYAYFSSYSASWLRHARAYAEQMIERLGLDSRSKVVEIASNDGYLLQYFKERGVPVLGVEPAANVAAAAREAGIPTLVEFFGVDTADELRASDEEADLLVGNNVLAHVPDLSGFVAGLKLLLKPGGVVTLEFPHLLRLIENAEFDTIYHEHVSYFSLLAVEHLFAQAGLQLFDVEELPTHGGSLRVYLRHAGGRLEADAHITSSSCASASERPVWSSLETYTEFDERVRLVKRELLDFLDRREAGGEVDRRLRSSSEGHDAAQLLRNPRRLRRLRRRSQPPQAGSLPARDASANPCPRRVEETRPDYLLLLAWNLKDEIIEQMSHVRAFGCRFLVPIPHTTVYE